MANFYYDPFMIFLAMPSNTSLYSSPKFYVHTPLSTKKEWEYDGDFVFSLNLFIDQKICLPNLLADYNALLNSLKRLREKKCEVNKNKWN